ncbi:DUF1292 domain-containing protein [Ectobacillus ponti]|uniref:UPF0473 protein NK662_01760 n=1 Tax=Ectobacillus ponti TaxID=2961894 RepID=A0AA41X5K7_9BACI|nr:DUF1292 domain-containing protein [Ectobacillus ponti]MCP8967265.1 DUF1292 domain-containing protein [Ectobacillus ponti]
MEENQITIVDEEGNEVLCDIVFTFENDQFGQKLYVVFSPIGEVDEDGERIYDAAIVVEGEGDDEGGSLLPIENEEEWEMVQEVFGAFLEDEEGEEE